jgi:hypothetical protein
MTHEVNVDIKALNLKIVDYVDWKDILEEKSYYSKSQLRFEMDSSSVFVKSYA